jgi:nicotinamide mononucleotide transporter
MYRAGLKAEALLYFYYVLAGVYGYWEWSRPQNQLKDHVLIQKWPIKNHILTLAVGGVLAIGMAQLMMYINSSYPYADSLTTVFSFIATWLVVKRVLSNWVYWIIIDVASAYIYYLKGLNYYTGMMVIYTVLAVWGYYKWLQEYRVQKG